MHGLPAGHGNLGARSERHGGSIAAIVLAKPTQTLLTEAGCAIDLLLTERRLALAKQCPDTDLDIVEISS